MKAYSNGTEMEPICPDGTVDSLEQAAALAVEALGAQGNGGRGTKAVQGEDYNTRV